MSLPAPTFWLYATHLWFRYDSLSLQDCLRLDLHLDRELRPDRGVLPVDMRQRDLEPACRTPAQAGRLPNDLASVEEFDTCGGPVGGHIA
jgi:hypothetical protein